VLVGRMSLKPPKEALLRTVDAVLGRDVAVAVEDQFVVVEDRGVAPYEKDVGEL
jgi:hypothetical protein